MLNGNSNFVQNRNITAKMNCNKLTTLRRETARRLFQANMGAYANQTQTDGHILAGVINTVVTSRRSRRSQIQLNRYDSIPNTRYF